MTYEIKSVKDEIKRNKDHFEVYIDGKFYCTADNHLEAVKDVEEYLKEGKIK